MFIKAFGDAAAAAAADRLGRTVSRETPVQGSPSHPVMGLAALVGLTGDLQGRLMLDFDPRAASALAGASSEDRHGAADFAEDVTERALAALRSAGVRIEATPPMVFTGRNLEVTNSRMETVTVPIGIPEGTLVVSIAAREGRS
jgi:chemotaxis protein CheX